MRPIAVNGITPFITAPDLIDRTVRLHLPGIPKSKRKKAEQLNADFEKELPRIFGALLDLFVKTLAELPNVKLGELPRMADFAELGEALRIAIGDSEPFVMTYEKTRRAAIENSLEASPAICALLEFLETRLDKTYEGSVGNLLTEIEAYKKFSDAWPKSPKGFSDALNRYSTALKEIGVSVEFNPIRQNDGRHVTVKKEVSFSSLSVGIGNQPSQPSLFFGSNDACDASAGEILIPTSHERKENVFSDTHSPDDDNVDFE